MFLVWYLTDSGIGARTIDTERGATLLANHLESFGATILSVEGISTMDTFSDMAKRNEERERGERNQRTIDASFSLIASYAQQGIAALAAGSLDVARDCLSAIVNAQNQQEDRT